MAKMISKPSSFIILVVAVDIFRPHHKSFAARPEKIYGGYVPDRNRM
jgi:hypothetical protein